MNFIDLKPLRSVGIIIATKLGILHMKLKLKGSVHSKLKFIYFLAPAQTISECNQSYCHAKHRLGVICKKKTHWSSGGHKI